MPVKLAPEPGHFHERVQKPGEEFLASTPHPTTKDWVSRDYWKHISKDLHAAYSGICAYSCLWISSDDVTVDHFKPKNKYPHEAYRWENYRLASHTMNGKKGEHEDVLDPFLLPPGWFIFDFERMIVKPGSHLSAVEKDAVMKTIKRLDLNGERCSRKRQEWLDPYLEGEVTFSLLKKRSPFIASELERQGLVEEICTRKRFPMPPAP